MKPLFSTDGYTVLIKDYSSNESTIVCTKLTEEQAIEFTDRFNGYVENYKRECGLLTEVQWATRERLLDTTL